jgi:hypothetical protein
MGGRSRSPLGAEDTRVLIKRMPHSIWPRDQRRVAVLVNSVPFVGNECPRATADRCLGGDLVTTRRSRSEVERAFVAKSTTTAKC